MRVAPGLVKTKFARVLWEGREEEAAAAYPLGRLGEPEDVAGIACFSAERTTLPGSRALRWLLMAAYCLPSPSNSSFRSPACYPVSYALGDR